MFDFVLDTATMPNTLTSFPPKTIHMESNLMRINSARNTTMTVTFMPIAGPTLYSIIMYFILLFWSSGVQYSLHRAGSHLNSVCRIGGRWIERPPVVVHTTSNGRARRSQWPLEMIRTINRAHSSLGHKSYAWNRILLEQRRRSKCVDGVNGVPVSMNNNFLPPHTEQRTTN